MTTRREPRRECTGALVVCRSQRVGTNLATSTTFEYFDAAGNLLATATAPKRSDAAGFSYVDAMLQSRLVARARITSGNTPIDPTVTGNVSSGGTSDIVVMDDVIYGEPETICRG